MIDPEKRKQYDMYGPEEERMQNAHSRQGHTHYNYTRGFEGKKVGIRNMYQLRKLKYFFSADITAEELFNMFFGVSFAQQDFYMRRPGGRWSNGVRQQDAQHSHSQVEQNGIDTVNHF